VTTGRVHERRAPVRADEIGVPFLAEELIERPHAASPGCVEQRFRLGNFLRHDHEDRSLPELVRRAARRTPELPFDLHTH